MAGATATATLRINTVMDTGDAIGNINQIQGALRKLKMPKDLTSKTEAKFEELTGLVKEYQNLLDKPHKSNADLRQLDQLGAKIKKVQEEIEKTIRHLDFDSVNFDDIHSEKIDELRVKLKKAEEEVKNFAKTRLIDKNFLSDSGKLKGELLTISNAIEKSSQRSKSRGVFSSITENLNTGNISKAITLTEQLMRTVNSGANRKENPIAWAQEAQPALNTFLNSLRVIDSEISQAGSGFSEAKGKVAQLTAELRQAIGLRVDELGVEANRIADGMSEAASATNTFHNSMSAAMHQQSEMAYQVQNLQQQIKNYFGLDEIFRKIGDLARSAMDTVKELDAAMTETAVVTNFDVSDMWKMLPTYTKNANQLGSTIADVYNAATLYYQQGLTTTQSMDLANETLKMARIGGIEAAEATDMMTAALRGFNMEINQTSAQRINDVYSKLAAITAADTKEIGTAMERTASISKSANMDFETTSAFLAQMIETTREAPENLGTAMKTIVARFQEMKVDPNSLIDSEGERLDFNRVDKALKSVGISLVDEQNQFRNLDDVFLEISSHWDGMTQAQQRYIATIAAGSRQQSRFIAMMQDYDRTMELVDAAYTAEGAGQAQFEKTLESMDSKLNRLKNAWDQFAMGFMNADFLKVGVDAGTKFLDIFEKIITGISQIGIVDPFKGIIKSALTATAVFGGLLGMSKLLMAGVGKFAGMVLGEENARQMGGLTGTAVNMAGGSPEMKKRISVNKALAKQAADAYNAEYYRALSEGKSKFEAIQSGRKGSRDVRLQARQMGLADRQILEPLRNQIGKMNLSAEGQQIVDNLYKSIEEKIKINDGNISEGLKEKIKQEIDEATSQLENIEEEEINLDLNLDNAGNQVTGLTNRFEGISASAEKAGIGIQSFAASLYGTPLQPFGMALNLVGQGLIGISAVIGGVGKAIKALQVASVLSVASTLGEAGAQELLAAAMAGANEQRLEAIALEKGLTAAQAKEAVSAALNAVGKGADGALGKVKSLGGGLLKLAGAHPVITGIAAGLAAIGIAAFLAYRHFTKGTRELQAQGDAAAQASQDLDTTKQALEAVNNDLDELANNDNALDGLVKGTTEWNNKLAEANAHIIEMMQNYSTLNDTYKNGPNEGEYKYIQTDEEGRMSITKSGQEAIRKEYENAVNLATANNAIQGALYNNKKDLNSKQYKDNQRTINVGATGTDAYKQAVLQNRNIEQANEARLENAWKTGIHAAISDLGIGDTGSIENILTDQRDKLVDAVQLGGKTDNKKAYADLMGYEYVKKDTYKDAQGNELEIDYSTVKEMLPELQALSDAQANAVSIQNSLNEAQSSYSTALANSENEELKKIEGQDTIISDILSSNAEANLSAVDAFVNSTGKEQTGLEVFADQYKTYSEENAKILSDLTGEDVNIGNYTQALQNLKSQLQQNADNMIQQQQDAISGVAGVLDAANWKKSGTGAEAEKASEDQIKKVIDKMTSAQIKSMSETAEGMSDNISNTISESYGKTVADLVDSGASQETIDKFQDAFDGIDFSSGLATLEGFNRALEIDNKRVREFGKEWDSSGEKANATAKAMQEVFSSDDFAEVEESLTESAKEMGHIDASAILTAAESSSSLKRYLDATGASAEGVAKAFELISDSSISITDLTPSVVAAANAMEQLSTSAGRANKFIENLEIKNDTGKYSDAIDSQKEAIDEMIENGEYGNEGLQQALSQTFGGKKWAEAYAEGTDGIKKLYDEYSKAANASAEDISGLYKEGDTVEKMIGRIQKAYGVSAEYADVMLQKATNADLKLKQALESRNKNQMINAAMETSGITDQNGKLQQKGGMTSAGEIYTQALLYGGDDVGKQQKYLKSYAEKLGLNVDKISETLDFANGDLEDWTTNLATASTHVANFNSSMSGKEVEKEMTKEWKSQGNTSETWWSENSRIEGQKDTYDIQGIVNQALANGANNTQAMEAAYEVVKRRIGDEGKTFKVGSTEFTEDDVKNWETFSQKFNEAVENTQWTEIGTTIGEQIVAKMQEAHFDNLMQESGVTQVNPYTNSSLQNGIFETNLNAVWKEAQENTSNRTLQVDAIGKYLGDFKAEFAKLDPAKQTEALDGLVTKMNDWEFSPEEIVTAINQGFDTNLTTDNVTGNKPGEYGLEINKEDLEGQLKGLEAEVTANITNITFSAKASGQNNRRFGTFARGSKHGYTIPGRPTLTGEEGEELVWEPKRNQAYMVGSNGPQFANISRDAVVWNADQTKRIKKNSGSVSGLGTGARGIKNFGTMGNPPQKGGTGGGGKSIGGLTLDATANIIEADAKAVEPVSIKADLKIDKDGKGGLFNKIKNLFGKGEKKEGYKIKVEAEAEKITVPQKTDKKVSITGKLDKITGVTNKKVTGVKATATVNKVTKGKKVSGEPIKVKAKATVTAAASTEGANAAIESAASKANTTQTMTIDGNNGPVMAKIQSAINKISSAHPSLSYSVSGPTSVTVDIWPRFQGSWVKTYTLKPSKARGQNYQKYNSYAGGRNLNSSKIKGETALTGEEGYEVVWLPKQNKSMIVGTQGPQMINLPPDAVIWPHDQSKKILNNNKGLPVNSFASGNTRYRVFKKKDKEQQREKISTSKSATSSKAFNLEQKILEVKRLQEEKQKELNKLLEKACVTFKDIEKVAKKDFKRLKDSVKLNEKLVNYYDNRLKKLDKTGKRTIEWSNPAQTRTKKNGKWKKWKSSGDKRHKASINLGNYIYKDEYGAYVVNYKKINERIGKKDKNKAKAVKEAAEKEIKELTSGRNSAEDDREKAKEEMKEIGKTMYDTFYAWENELTKIEEVTRKIAELEEKITKLKSGQQLSDSILNAGYSLSNKLFDINAFRAEMQTTVNTIKKRGEAIGLQREEIQNTISSEDERKEYKEAKKAWQNTKPDTVERETEATRKDAAWDRYQAAEKSKNYIQATTNTDGTINITINEDLLEKDKDYKNISTELYEKIKKHYDKLVEQNNKLNELYESQTSALSELYDTFTNLREEYASHSEELLKGLESFEEEEANALQKLDSTISNTLKDIISEVRRSIDMRRRQEDNAKKEEDIFKKQQRLSALRASTGNNYAVEIAQLEKEIAEAQQSYGRDLEDQQLQILEDQGEKAAEQRERQIQILNSQLDYAKATGANIELIDKLLLNPDANREEIIKYWKKANNYDESTGKRKEILDIQLKAFLEDLDLKRGIPAKMKDVKTAIDQTKLDLNLTLGRIENLVKATLDQVTLAKMRKAQKATAEDLRKEGFGATTLRKAGYTATQLQEGGFSTKSIVNAGYNKNELKQAGITPDAIKKWNEENSNNKISASKVHGAGFTAEEAHKMGYSDTEIRKGGYTIQEFKKYTGRSVEGARLAEKAGYSNNEITEGYGSRIGMTQFGVSGKTAQDINGTSSKILQKIVNASKDDKATQKDMAGVQVGKVDVNGKEKGGTIKDSHISSKGTRVGANKGSTLYTADWDEKTGKVKGKWTAYTIDKLTTSLIKKYPIDATQALEYAIKKTKVGSKINKDFGSLVKAAKLTGKTYTLKNNASASLGADGNLYYNIKNGNIQRWDTSKGSLKTYAEYNKKKFLEKAKKNDNISREYAQALIKKGAYTKDELKKKGVKKFASGGLVDSIGLAWLDGTPSKPELVLNAQDTQNFMALKDVLSRAIGSIDSGNQNSYNNANFEININVDHINNDYDVEKIAKKVKKEIVQSSNYRNVTQVRNLR